MGETLTRFATGHPRLVTAVILVVTLFLGLLAGIPSIWPDALPGLSPLRVDTDPENMLREDEPVRIVNHRMKQALGLHPIVVLGMVNEEHPQGVFNPESLRHAHELAEFAASLRGAALGQEDPQAGVVAVDLIAPSTVDNIEQAGPGTVRFEWLMATPPDTDAEALAIRDRARRIPLLNGTLVSEDGLALALYLPLTSKNLSYRVAERLQERIDSFTGNDQFFITGLPVAEDTFGVEMFIQMAISAPLAMLAIFLLMLLFFRKLVLIISPMIIAMVTVICTMALLVATGNTIHIMSSMIPIFIMPIAVLDSVHILSEFFDRYPAIGKRREAILEVMRALFKPMLFTSLTSAAGFASLALTPIPPVRVFGIFVAFGVLAAWFLTIVFIPAFVMLIPETSLRGFGMRHEGEAGSKRGLTGMLAATGEFAYRRPGVILAVVLVGMLGSAYGISLIQVNDNPTRWFHSGHPIRVADRVLNEHFAGTYMAYLAFTPRGELPDEFEAAPAGGVPEIGGPETGGPALPAGLEGLGEPSLPAGLGGAPVESRTEDIESAAAAKPETFKDPATLRYLTSVQEHLVKTGVVGKSSSIADIVMTVHRELIDGSEAQFRIPDSAAAVAQSLVQYQSSHRPNDLWHFVTPDYRTANLWLQLKSGDNKDMESVVSSLESFMADHPPPGDLEARWFGLTYINVVWQEKMVAGMAEAFLSSFVVVLLMMILLFRSFWWGLLSMVPLTVTIAAIYGVIGLIGKDFDMPVAVLSSLTLGLAVDFAIHFLARARELYSIHGSWSETYRHVFGEPARAIARNVIVIAVGFTPLLAAPLVPYNTVGVFLASILVASGLATLLILPAALRLFESRFFPKT